MLYYLIFAFVIYKIVDWLIRIPFIKRKLGTKYVLITGCDTGFGNMLAIRLDRKGIPVIAGCLTEKGETELRKLCSSKLKTVAMDISKPESIKKAYDAVKTLVPVESGIWAIMNNAGIVGNTGPAEWLTLEDYHQVFGVNLFGMAEVTRVFLPLLKRGKKGRVVNTASIVGRFAIPFNAPYCTSKFAVEAYSDILRRELKPFGISVHIIEPGFHMTNVADPKSLTKSFDNSWNRMSQDMRDEYGQEYHDKYVNMIKEETPKFLSTRLDDVVDSYEHAIFSQFPRDRYQVGWDSRLFWIPISNLAACVQDVIIKAMAKTELIPAACKK